MICDRGKKIQPIALKVLSLVFPNDMMCMVPHSQKRKKKNSNVPAALVCIYYVQFVSFSSRLFIVVLGAVLGCFDNWHRAAYAGRWASRQHPAHAHSSSSSPCPPGLGASESRGTQDAGAVGDHHHQGAQVNQDGVPEMQISWK